MTGVKIQVKFPFIIYGLCLMILSCSGRRSGEKLRETLNFDDRWEFVPDSLQLGIKEGFPSGDLPGGRTVLLPHTWNVMPGLEDYYGWGWYQKKFNLPVSWKNKLVKLKFNAVYRDVTIWLNGHRILSRTGCGYTPFDVCLNPYAVYDSMNRITLLVSNAYSRKAIPMEKSFDWPNDGGIIRNVYLVKTASPSIDNVFITPVYNDRGKGTVNLRIVLDSTDLNSLKSLDVWYNISHKGLVAAKGNTKLSVSNYEASFSVDIRDPVLWRFDDPALYDIKLAVGKDLSLTDYFISSFGFRNLHTNGIHLIFNGDRVRLPGLEWMPGSDTIHGMAEDTVSFYKMLELLKGTNAVLTRFHWPQDDRVLDWCDRHGLLVQEELPLWARPGPGDLNDTTWEIVSRQAEEMINAHYNHPSIIAWGIGNELASDNPKVYQFINRIRGMVLGLDSSRMVDYVSNRLHESPGFDATASGDIMMWNEYTGLWYAMGNPPYRDSDDREILSTIHEKNPDKCLVISEYGLCEPVFKGGDPRRISHMIFHTKLYDSLNYIGGVIYFCLNDYRTHIGEMGSGKARERVHGITDIDGNRKPSYDTLKSLFSPVRDFHAAVSGNKILITGINHNGIPSYPLIRYYSRLVYQDKVDSGEVQTLPVIAPGSKFNAAFSDRGKGQYTMEIFSPDNRMVQEYNFTLE